MVQVRPLTLSFTQTPPALQYSAAAQFALLLHAAHFICALQKLLWQSALVLQLCVLAQSEHTPPQSMSLSAPSRT